MGVPYTFGTATTSIPLSQLDANFNTPVTLGNTTVGLGNTVTTVGNLTLTNVTITSGTINAAVVDSGYVANSVVYANSTGVLTAGSANLTFDGTNLTNAGVGTFKSVVLNGVGTSQLSTSDASGMYLTATTAGGMYIASDNFFMFRKASSPFSEYMRIDSSGNVGIGTSSPSVRLDVNGGRSYFAANNEPYSIGVRYNGSTNGVFIGSPSADTLTISSWGGTERMRIDSSGNVGIGCTPSAVGAYRVLELNNTTGGMMYMQANGSRVLQIYGAAAESGIYNVGSSPLAFGTANTERMRITSAGVLVINSSAPETTISGGTPIFQVTGSGFNAIGAFTRRQNDANGSALCLAKSRNTSANSYTVVQNGDTLGAIIFIGDDGTDLDTYGAVISAQVDGTPGANDMPGRLVFSTTADGAATVTERMRIASDGNVGIGTTTTSTYKVNIANNGGNQLRLYATDVSTTTTNTIDFWYLDAGGSPYNNTSIRSLSTANAGNGNLVFYTRPTSGSLTEVMRITSSGFTKISNNGTYFGSTGPYHEIRSDVANDGTLLVQSTSASFTANSIYQQIERNTTNNTFYAYSYYNGGAGAYKYRIADSGNVTNTNGSYGTISDVKNKENIVDATPKLDKINQLQVRNFNFKGDDLKQIGFIAQEFEQVFPSMVEEHKDTDAEGNDLGTTTKSIKTSVLVPILVKAIQEQQAMIEELKQEVAKLKGV